MKNLSHLASISHFEDTVHKARWQPHYSLHTYVSEQTFLFCYFQFVAPFTEIDNDGRLNAMTRHKQPLHQFFPWGNYKIFIKVGHFGVCQKKKKKKHQKPKKILSPILVGLLRVRKCLHPGRSFLRKQQECKRVVKDLRTKRTLSFPPEERYAEKTHFLKSKLAAVSALQNAQPPLRRLGNLIIELRLYPHRMGIQTT